MGKSDKLLDKALRNSKGLSFEEFQNLMQRVGWVKDRQKGSHEIWYSPGKYRLSAQNRHGKAKEYQVKQFLKRYLEEIDDET